MATLFVTTRSGSKIELAVEPGRSIMERLRQKNIGDIEAICGGACACATCHIFVDPDQFDQLPDMSDDERGMLDISEHRRPESRLACQIMLTDQIDRLRITIAPEE